MGLSIAIFGFIIDLYLIWLVIGQHDERHNRLNEEVRFGQERDKYFRLLIEHYGMSYYTASEMYKQVPSFEKLVSTNIEMEKHIL